VDCDGDYAFDALDVNSASTNVGAYFLANARSYFYALRNSSGSFAIFAAIRRASSLLSNLAAESSAGLILEIDVAQRLTVDVAHDVA